jgi:hypothetical protein
MAKPGIVAQAGQRGADVSAAGRVVEYAESIAELIEALKVEKGTAKYGYEKVRRRISECRPDLVYPHFDFFAGERHGRLSPDCHNVAIGCAIEAFDQLFDQIEDRIAVIEFVKRQLKNTRKQVAGKAIDSSAHATPPSIESRHHNNV